MAPLLLILVVLLREHLATNHLRMPRLPWVEKGLVACHGDAMPQSLMRVIVAGGIVLHGTVVPPG